MISNLRLKLKVKEDDNKTQYKTLKSQNGILRTVNKSQLQNHPKQPTKIKVISNRMKEALKESNSIPIKKDTADFKKTQNSRQCIKRQSHRAISTLFKTQHNHKQKMSTGKKIAANNVFHAKQQKTRKTISLITKKEPKILKGQQRYLYENKVGSGTFGIVFKARDKITLEQVAIKQVFQDKKYKNRQLEILKIIDNPNVVKMKDSYYSYEGEKEYLNVVMDYYPYNLAQYIRKHAKSEIPKLKIKLYSYQLFKALLYLERIQIAHRDIKPQNILVNDQIGRLIICDLGSAKKIEPNQSNLAYICSRAYRAPELIFGCRYYATPIDVWSAGCILIQLVTHEPAFRGTNNIDQLVEIIKVLGSPSREEIFEMNSECEIEKYTFPKINGVHWQKFFNKKSIGSQFCDLLRQIMLYNPKKRSTPLQLLNHHFFDELKDEQMFNNLKKQYKIQDLFNFSSVSGLSATIISSLTPNWYTTKSA